MALHRFRSAAGITMIEIAVVILIVGILLGSVLGYQEMMRLVMLRKIANEVQSFGSAARGFEEKYSALPGDFANADEMINGCQAGNPNFCQNGDGDNQIGRYCFFSWPECIQTGPSIPASDPNGVSIPPNVPLETSNFWKHLYFSGFIGGIVTPDGNPNAPVWGQSHPKSAREGAGYIISGGGSFLGGYVTVNFLPTPVTNPNQAILVGEPGADKALTVQDGFYMDEKFDDGQPGSGKLWWNPISQGGPNGCRRDDGGNQNTWEDGNLEGRNCIFNWGVY